MLGLCNLGKVGFITGAGTSGIGRAIAIKLAELGTTMIVTDVKLEAAQETVSLLPTFEGQRPHEALALDVTNREQVFSTMAYVQEKYGTLDILYNNAGVSTMHWLQDIPEKDWDFNFNVNVKGMFFVMQAAFPLMKENGGKIINTSSIAGLAPDPMLAHYTASKFAVVGLSKNAAKEFAQYGITVNCICPGYTKTDMQEREIRWAGQLRGMDPEEVRQEYINMAPLKDCVLMPEHIANVAYFLASPLSYGITGQCLVIAGGSDL